MAVLTEELGHHLDGLLNPVDTHGDQGELFARLLAGAQLGAADLLALRTQSDQTQVVVNGQGIAAEAAIMSSNVIAAPIAPTSPGRTRGELRNIGAFAALKPDGSVVTWGYGGCGGDSSSVASQLKSGVIQIFSTDSAFSALKADGAVVSWGASGSNSSPSSGVIGFANPFTNDWRVVISTPSITLIASHAHVTEDGTSNMIYTFYRTGAINSELMVNYTVRGTARHPYWYHQNSQLCSWCFHCDLNRRSNG